MWIRSFLHGLAAVVLLPLFCQAQDTPEQIAFFESKIRPVLVKECFGCHSDRTGKMRGGLRLDTRQLILTGGESGPAVVPKDPDESLLLQSMMHEGLAMPPKRKLSDKVIADFRQWIEMGAPDPRETAAATVQSTVSKADVKRARETFWAYQSVEKTSVPKVENTDWSKTDIDRFILSKLEQAELQPATDDEPYRVLRRLSFDLLGLPPTLEQIEHFKFLWEKDPDAAIANVVDSYLKKEQFGERWARHWLDVARYAESTGYAVNLTYPHAWRYRDYVIDSFNKDKPYNRFVEEQLAGDLLPAKDDAIWAENLVATSFLAIGPKNINEMNPAQFQADLIDEQVDATSRVFLGMSVACARCHDHKFDAIPQSDYYAMAGFFSSSKTFYGSQQPSKNPMVQQDSGILEFPINAPGPVQKTYTAKDLAALQAEIDSTRAELRANRGNGAGFKGIQKMIRVGQLENELAGLDENGKPKSYCMGVQCSDSPRDATLLLHGEVDQPGDEIPRGFPSVLSAGRVKIKGKTSGRRELANWIVDDRNPLTARVMVNRVWQHLLGQGIVGSPNDFGATGQPPSHPELLDYLADRFVKSGWSIKSLVRDITTSRVYRMRSDTNKTAFAFDPTNSLLWRANPRRLDAEAIRDNMLAVSGQLDLKRQHGSEVARAGFVRVQNGVLEELTMGGGGRMGGGGGRMGGMSGGRQGGAGGGRQQGGRAGGNQPGGQGPGGNRAGGMKGPGGRAGGNQAPGDKNAGGGGGMGGKSGWSRSTTNADPNRLDMNAANFRSIYLPQVRSETSRSLDVFDGADNNAIVAARATSQTADQALYLMNNPFVLAQSQAFAKRLKAESKTQSAQIEKAFQLAYGRPPFPEEERAAAAMLKDMRDASNPLALLCQSLLASAEFTYVY